MRDLGGSPSSCAARRILDHGYPPPPPGTRPRQPRLLPDAPHLGCVRNILVRFHAIVRPSPGWRHLSCRPSSRCARVPHGVVVVVAVVAAAAAGRRCCPLLYLSAARVVPVIRVAWRVSPPPRRTSSRPIVARTFREAGATTTTTTPSGTRVLVVVAFVIRSTGMSRVSSRALPIIDFFSFDFDESDMARCPESLLTRDDNADERATAYVSSINFPRRWNGTAYLAGALSRVFPSL